VKHQTAVFPRVCETQPSTKSAAYIKNTAGAKCSSTLSENQHSKRSWFHPNWNRELVHAGVSGSMTFLIEGIYRYFCVSLVSAFKIFNM
jgi:hypothetical protein